MPLFSTSPTTLSSGEKLAVLNAENLGSGALTQAVSLTPQPTSITLAIYNNSGQTVDLVASPDFTSANYLPVYNEAGVAVTAATDTVATAQVAAGLNYAIKAGGAITAGTVWLAR